MLLSTYLLSALPLNLYLWLLGNHYSQPIQQITDQLVESVLYVRAVCLVLSVVFSVMDLARFQTNELDELDAEGQ